MTYIVCDYFILSVRYRV